MLLQSTQNGRQRSRVDVSLIPSHVSVRACEPEGSKVTGSEPDQEQMLRSQIQSSPFHLESQGLVLVLITFLSPPPPLPPLSLPVAPLWPQTAAAVAPPSPAPPLWAPRPNQRENGFDTERWDTHRGHTPLLCGCDTEAGFIPQKKKLLLFP